MKKFSLILIALFAMSACSESDSEPKADVFVLMGEFTELSPQVNRTTLIFTENDQLQEIRITDGENHSIRSNTIRLLDPDMIELSSNNADEQFPRVFYFHIVDANTFEMGNLNETDPAETIMTFLRE